MAAATSAPKPKAAWLCTCFGAPSVLDSKAPAPAPSSANGCAAPAAAAPAGEQAGGATNKQLLSPRSSEPRSSWSDTGSPRGHHAPDTAAAAAAAAAARLHDDASLKAQVSAIRPIKTHVTAASGGSGSMADSTGARLADQNTPRTPTLAELKHLMASSLNRPYTDKDWFAAMKVLETIMAHQRARAMQQLRIAGNSNSHSGGGGGGGGGADAPAGARLARDSFASAHSGGTAWHDARSHTMSDVSLISDADKAEVALIAEELDLLRGPVSVVRELDCTPACVPNPPLLFAEPHWKYRPVDCAAFCAYWERDSVRSTPFPLPIDGQLKLNALQRRTHETIPGMWMHMLTPTQMELVAAPDIMAIPGVVSYNEYFNTDSSIAHWALRRDIRIGRTQGQMFMTTDGILIFRVFTTGMFSKTVEWTGEDFMRLEDNGETIITRQLCKHFGDNTVEGGQFLVGRKRGLKPPPRRSLLHPYGGGGH